MQKDESLTLFGAEPKAVKVKKTSEKQSQQTGDGLGGMYEGQYLNEIAQSMANAGITLLNDDACGKLLAIMYVYASHSEAFLCKKKLQREWRFAQYRFKIVGGETPRAETLPIFQKYARIYSADYDKGIINQDAQDFMKKRYGLEIIIDNDAKDFLAKIHKLEKKI